MFPSIIHSYSILHLPTVDSTNNYAASKENQPNIQHKTVIVASFQSNGKGQFHNKWQSEAGLNLLFSIYLQPKKLSATQQFDLSRISALALRDSLSYFLTKQITIKWPNDIFIEGKKIAGILIENTVTQNRIDRSIIGIGINVNQKIFEGLNASSFLIESGKKWELKRILEFFLYRFDLYYETLNENRHELLQSFDLHLHDRNKWLTMHSHKNKEFLGRIVGTNENGMLIVEDSELKIHHFNHKEISFS
jgi:BirA family biotin operon repressor/biotin-[acetyl-CoA-carboxylase] ligase